MRDIFLPGQDKHWATAIGTGKAQLVERSNHAFARDAFFRSLLRGKISNILNWELESLNRFPDSVTGTPPELVFCTECDSDYRQLHVRFDRL